MKRKLLVILVAEAIISMTLCLFVRILEGAFTSLMTFPFEQIGLGLRMLSKSSAAGNIIAIIIYCILCLLPAAYLAFRVIKSRAHAEDGLLALLSIVLFAVIYLMINPAYIARYFGSSDLVSINKTLIGVAVYSIIVGYLILRALRVFSNSETGSTLKYLKYLLAIICAVLIYGIFGSGLMKLVSSFWQLSIGNTGQGQDLALSYIFLVLQYFVDILPFCIEIVVIFSGLELINSLEKDQYGEAVAAAARKIGRICRFSVAAILLSQIGVNVLQLALGSLVRSSHYSLSIPLLSVVFVLAAMLLAGYFERVRRLKDDNDMII